VARRSARGKRAELVHCVAVRVDRELAQIANVAGPAARRQVALDHGASAEPSDGERPRDGAAVRIAKGVAQRRIEQREGAAAQQRAKRSRIEAGQQRQRGVRDGATTGRVGKVFALVGVEMGGEPW
jgi:hypothetical protein